MSYNCRQLFLFSSLILIIITFPQLSDGIRCYQCSSSDDKESSVDNCGVYSGFNKDKNIPVDCQGDEAVTPGTFCVKITQQSPRGFIWDGRWRQVIRRCASVSDTGVTGVCNWGIYENGVYWEECYCSEDSCNSSNIQTYSKTLLKSAVLALIIFNYFIFRQ